MANTGIGGLNVRQTSGGKLIFEAGLVDATGDIVISGNALLYLYEEQDDGTLKSYDWNDNTFKTGALTTENPSPAMAHQTGNNSTTNTGVWTKVLSTVSGFTKGAVYLAMVKHTGASPIYQWRKFQYGSAEGDITLDTNNYVKADVEAVVASTPSAAGLKNMGLSVISGTVVSDAGNTASTFKTDLTETQTDYYGDGTAGGCVLVFISGANDAIQARRISAYNGTTKFVTLESAFDAAPTAGDTFIILGRIEI